MLILESLNTASQHVDLSLIVRELLVLAFQLLLVLHDLLCLVIISLSELFNLLFQRGHFDLKGSLVLLGIIQKLTGLVQLSLVHSLDGSGLLAPFGLQLVQLLGQLAVLGLKEAHLLDVGSETLVEVLHVLLFLVAALFHRVYAMAGEVSKRTWSGI